MALRRDLTYPGRYSSATSAQPQGAFLNRSTPTSNDGSYPEQQWQNDWSALFSSLLVNAGITPNNAVDSVGDSQYFDALMQLISRPNVLINSDLTFANAINQRGVANWGAVALNDYGLDRWKKVDTSTIVQPIEQGNFIPNETYTLSWNNGADSRVIVAPTSGDWENSDLEIPITATGATKLEIGKNKTPWAGEKISNNLMMCSRYYQTSVGSSFPMDQGGDGPGYGRLVLFNTGSNGWVSSLLSGSTSFRTPMRTTPSMRFADARGNIGKLTNVNVGSDIAPISGSPVSSYSSVGFSLDVRAIANTVMSFQWDADAEI